MTNIQKQYWEIKSENFDKIIFFRIYPFYEVYFDDAIICHKLLDCNWVGGKMWCLIHQASVEKYGNILVKAGYKVGLVDQVEQEWEKQQKSNIIKRSLTQVYTKGTMVEQANNIDYHPRFTLTLFFSSLS